MSLSGQQSLSVIGVTRMSHPYCLLSWTQRDIFNGPWFFNMFNVIYSVDLKPDIEALEVLSLARVITSLKNRVSQKHNESWDRLACEGSTHRFTVIKGHI